MPIPCLLARPPRHFLLESPGVPRLYLRVAQYLVKLLYRIQVKCDNPRDVAVCLLLRLS